MFGNKLQHTQIAYVLSQSINILFIILFYPALDALPEEEISLTRIILKRETFRRLENSRSRAGGCLIINLDLSQGSALGTSVAFCVENVGI